MPHDQEKDSPLEEVKAGEATHAPARMLDAVSAQVGGAAMQRKLQRRMQARTSAAKPGAAASPAAHAASAGASGVKGGALNVDLTHLNDHPGPDANRLGPAPGKNFVTTAAGSLYANDGTAGAAIPKGAHVEINAGAVCDLVLAGAKDTKPEKCVYIFDFDKQSGWLPASCLPKAALADDVQVAGRIEAQRNDAHRKFGHGEAIRTGITAATDGVENLYTYPNQNTAQNMAKYYYGGLALNVPATGGNRVGVIATNLPPPSPLHALDPYREFYPVVPAQEVTIPLYEKGSSKATGKTLHFIYGYVKNDTGEQLHGWINRSLLPLPPPPAPSLAAVDKQFHKDKSERLEEDAGAKTQADAWAYGEELAAAVATKDASVPALIKGLGQYKEQKKHDPKNSLGFSPTAHGSGTRYFDDNSWIGLDLMQRYAQNGNPGLLAEAQRMFAFIKTGQEGGKNPKTAGGVKWDDDPKSTSENTASTAPAAELAMRLYLATVDHHPAEAAGYLAFAKRAEAFLQTDAMKYNAHDKKPGDADKIGLYKDHEGHDPNQKGAPNAIYAYNQGAPIGLDLLLYQSLQKTDPSAANTYFQRARDTATAALIGDKGVPGVGAKSLLNQSPFFVAIYFRNLFLFGSISANDPHYAAATKLFQDAAAALDAYVAAVQKNDYDSGDGLFDKGSFGRDDKTHKPSLVAQTSLVEIFAIKTEFDRALSQRA